MLLPGTTGAEPWGLWSAAGASDCLRVFGAADAIQSAREALVALPVAEVVSLTLWLQETRHEELARMIALQIEAQGLQTRGQEPVFDWSIVAQEEKRTLVLVGVLAFELPAAIEGTTFAGFDLSARCFSPPADAVIFWHEQDRLVMAVTRGDRLAYFHALTEEAFTSRVLQEITCILAALRMRGVIEKLARAVLWLDFAPANAARLASALALEPQQETRPEPRWPSERWLLTPRRVTAATREQSSRRWRGRTIAVVALLAVLMLAALGVRFALLTREVAQLQHWHAVHAAELAAMHQTAATWKDLQPAVDTRHYPMEILLHVSEALPGHVHLTLFDLEGHHLLLRAEAKDLTSAFEFVDRLKKSAPLAGFEWEMAQPHLLGNDVTQLQVEGTYADTH